MKIDKNKFFFNLAIGCLAQGTQACQNVGNCINNNGVGTCSCPLGYSGITCQTPLGCVSEGDNKCINGGFCNFATGLCQCPVTYTGLTCQTCKFFIAIYQI